MTRRKRIEGFRKAEASLRLEGMDPSGTPRYESVKARVISGEITHEQGKAEIFAYHVRRAKEKDSASPEDPVEPIMRPYNPPHPGEIIADSLAETGMSVGDLAERMAVSVTLVGYLLSGSTPVDAAIAEKLSAAIGSSAQFWLYLQQSYSSSSERRM